MERSPAHEVQANPIRLNDLLEAGGVTTMDFTLSLKASSAASNLSPLGREGGSKVAMCNAVSAPRYRPNGVIVTFVQE